MTEFFATIRSKAIAAAREGAAQDEAMTANATRMANVFSQIQKLQKDLDAPPPGVSRKLITSQIQLLERDLADHQCAEDKMEEEFGGPPESNFGDEFASGAPFIPVPSTDAPGTPPPAGKPWPQANYEGYIDQAASLFPPAPGKMSLDVLLFTMEEPTDSKLLLPRALELYSVQELRKAASSGQSVWQNRYEDPLDPVKCWSKAEFTQVYSRPGYHFMIARVAQLGPQSKDPKLNTLLGMLKARWGHSLTITTLDPRQDWMFCTVPENSTGYEEILKTDLIRIHDGNASYVVRRFGLASTSRDLEFTVRGSTGDGDSIYAQLRKKQLEFESSGVSLGWRVAGVRRAGAMAKYRGTFILDSHKTFWPWSMDFGHKHGSIPPASPLLNFDTTWSARRPYACQCCYSSDHSTFECPLANLRIGGVPVVSFGSRDLVLRKKAAERLIITDRSLIPTRVAPDADPKSAPALPVPENKPAAAP